MKTMQIEISLQGEPVWIVSTMQDDVIYIEAVFENQWDAKEFYKELRQKGYTVNIEMWTIK